MKARFFRDAPIKRRLRLIGLLSLSLAFFSIITMLTARAWVEGRSRMVAELSTYAGIVGTNATPALLFDDRKSARDTLAALVTIPDIVYAAIDDKSGQLFAVYHPPGHELSPPEPLPSVGDHRFTADSLVLADKIVFKGEALGVIYLQSSLDKLYFEIIHDSAITVIAAFIAILLASFLLARLQKGIIGPIRDLATVMQTVSREQNYAVRTPFQRGDEVGALAQVFNEMLEQIQARDTALEAHRAHLEQDVAQRTARLTEAQRIAHLGNWEWDVAHDRLDWSDEIYRIFGLAPQQFGATYAALLQAVHPEDRRYVDTQVHEALELNRPYSIDHRILQPDGSLRHVHEQAEVLRDESGLPAKMIGTVQDITERKLAEEAIRRQQELMTQIIETIPLRIFWKDHDSRYLGCNSLFAQDAGLARPDELIGKTDFEMSWREQAELYRVDDKQVMDSAVPKLSYDEPQTTPQGRLIWLRTSKVPLRDETHEVAGVLGVYEDITDYKHMELRLQESEERFRKAFQYSAIGMALVGLDGRWLKVNDSLCRIVGYREQELLVRTFQDITHPDDLQADLAYVAQLMTGEIDHYQMEKRYFHKDGHVVWIRLSVSLIRDAQSNPIYFVSQIDDITEDKQSKEAIRTLNEDLEKRVQERTKQLLDMQEELVRKEKLAVLGQVAGSVGHELRNPLGVMNNAVYFLKMVLSDADETVHEYLDIIGKEIAGSERIVSDLLDSVRTKPPQPLRVWVRDLIEETLKKCMIPQGVTVRLDIPDGLSPIRVDPQQMQQVFHNLIANGVDAMPEEGDLEIVAEQDGEAGRVRISIRDSGVGIKPEHLGRLFQPLFTTKARGIGLGLVVVKNLTQANGGTVEVESELGKGTRFTVSLPAEPMAGAA